MRKMNRLNLLQDILLVRHLVKHLLLGLQLLTLLREARHFIHPSCSVLYQFVVLLDDTHYEQRESHLFYILPSLDAKS